jgi:peptidoglycan L-alanyl-D-glutamate endopeptidase CwlK
MDPLFGWLIGVLALTLLLLWLICFPEVRLKLWRHVTARSKNVTRLTKKTLRRSSENLRSTSLNARDNASHLTRRLGRHWPLLLALLLILLLPPTLILGLRGHVTLDGYDTTPQADQGTTALVSSLLKGEQLVPPPALPPAVFVTREVEMVRPDLGLASRNWAKLDDDFQQRLLVVLKIMKERYGYDMALIEGYRSPERQAELAAQGSNVTNAGAYQSYHQYGLAADCAFYRNGKLVISEKDPWAMRGYQLYGQVAEAAGLVWGGSWKMMDLGHAELHKPGMGPHRRQGK